MADNEFHASLQSLTDRQLIESIQLGEESFQEGYYSYYLDEAKRRNLKFEIISKANITKTKLKMIKIPRIIIAWIIFIVLYILSQLMAGGILLAIFGEDIRYGEDNTLLYTKILESVLAFFLGFIMYYLSIKWFQKGEKYKTDK